MRRKGRRMWRPDGTKRRWEKGNAQGLSKSGRSGLLGAATMIESAPVRTCIRHKHTATTERIACSNAGICSNRSYHATTTNETETTD